MTKIIYGNNGFEEWFKRFFSRRLAGPQLSTERELIVDVISFDKEIKVVVEIPGVTKQDVKVNTFDHSVDISAETPDKKYHRVVEVPSDADLDSVQSTYKNGILELTFKRKHRTKEIQVW